MVKKFVSEELQTREATISFLLMVPVCLLYSWHKEIIYCPFFRDSPFLLCQSKVL